jgi:hypothetical protein
MMSVARSRDRMPLRLTPSSTTARRAAIGALAIASLTLVGACSDEQRRSLGEEDARASLSSRTGAAADAAGGSVDGDLDCTASIDTSGEVTAACTGTTVTGDAVTGDFTGTADVDAETCEARLVVTVAGQPVTDEAAVDCFALA